MHKQAKLLSEKNAVSTGQHRRVAVSEYTIERSEYTSYLCQWVYHIPHALISLRCKLLIIAALENAFNF